MNFELSEEQKLIQQAARDFARAEIEPVAVQSDREAHFPPELMDKARDVGLVNVTIPTEFGGSGLGVFELVLVTQELAWGCAGINGTLGLNSVIADVFHVAGSVEQKTRAFARLNDGEFGGYALTEPGAGSDVSAIKTRAVRSGDAYVINGSKVWISNATLAKFFLVFAKTDPQGKHRGISVFLVD